MFRGLCKGGGPIGEAVNFVTEMTDKGILPEFSSFSMLAEGLLALGMEDRLVRLVNLVMTTGNFKENDHSMVMGYFRIRKYNDGLAMFGHLLDSRRPRNSR